VTDGDEGPFSKRLISLVAARYPPFETITARQFEEFVADVLKAAGGHAESFSIETHETIHGSDGTYEFDAVARYRVLGLTHTLLIEAKRHANPIKRELVQALHAKLQSVGAHKALMVSASRYQSGAVRYALAHGIALATVSEGRLTFEAKSFGDHAPLTPEAAEELGIEPIAAMAIHNVPGTSSIRGFRLSPRHGEILLDWLADRT
jgi:hypothetical protein